MKKIAALLMLAASLSLGENQNHLTLNAELPAAVVSGGKISAVLELRNTSADSTVQIESPRPSLIRVEVAGSSREAAAQNGYIGSALNSSKERFEPPVQLGPGESIRLNTSFSCLRSDDNILSNDILTRVGEYRVRFAYPIVYESVPRQSALLYSPWYTLVVTGRDRATEASRTAFAAIPNVCWVLEPDEAALRAGHDDSGAWEKGCLEFLASYPGDGHEGIVRIALSKFYSACAARSGDPEKRSLYIRKALSELDAIAGIQDEAVTKEALNVRSDVLLIERK